MALKKVNFAAGFNKQGVPSALPGKWVDGDFVRFRYTAPEKIGGWSQLTASSLTLPGAARAQVAFTSLKGEKYAAIGTSQGLFLYYGNDFYDISPLDTAITGGTLTTTNGSNVVTINKGSHNLQVGRYVTLSAVTVTGASDFTAAELQQAYEILTVPDVDKFTVQASRNEGGSGMTAAGAVTVNPYVEVGPTIQTVGYGWGTSTWSTSTWGTERATSAVTLDPGNWSLDNFGEVLVATIFNGETFTWNAGATNARTIRASKTTSNFQTTNNPTASRFTLVSDRDRHLFHFGTETTIGDTTTQDPMFVRFSNQEDLNTYAPTATNTAGTFRLDTGNKITSVLQGKDYVFVLTDQAAYVIQFVGPPFTFSVRQVGTNCGCIGQHAASYVNGAIYWMSNEGGFFMYDGTVKALPCLVEDFVFTTQNGDLGLNFNSADVIFSSPNSLFTEVNWFYPKDGSDQIDRCVTYNFQENCWTTSSLDRTSYQDQGVFNKPYATDYESTGTPVFPDILGITNKYGASIYYAHEVGNDQVNSSGTTSIDAFIRSGDFDIDDGEFFMSMKRFMPDYKFLVGNSKVTIFISDFPSDTQASSALGPFTITSTTDKVDTRARARLLSIKIECDAVGETWRYGSFRLDAQPDGRR
mgnify:FL=1|tara:strand:+ start:2263 stop:4179 length:1917 start_codon:yes stop_codon:yes gene_type:complete